MLTNLNYIHQLRSFSATILLHDIYKLFKHLIKNFNSLCCKNSPSSTSCTYPIMNLWIIITVKLLSSS